MAGPFYGAPGAPTVGVRPAVSVPEIDVEIAEHFGAHARIDGTGGGGVQIGRPLRPIITADLHGTPLAVD